MWDLPSLCLPPASKLSDPHYCDGEREAQHELPKSSAQTPPRTSVHSLSHDGPMTTNGWTDPQTVIHTVECYSAIKRNEALTPATTWMTLGNMTPRERRQMQRATYHMVPSIGNVQMENKWVV